MGQNFDSDTGISTRIVSKPEATVDFAAKAAENSITGSGGSVGLLPNGAGVAVTTCNMYQLTKPKDPGDISSTTKNSLNTIAEATTHISHVDVEQNKRPSYVRGTSGNSVAANGARCTTTLLAPKM